MNMATGNPAVAGGPVGAGMMMMNSGGSPANPMNNNVASTDLLKVQLNTYIYEYLLKTGMYEVARQLSNSQDKFKFRVSTKSSPGSRKNGDMNGIESDPMDMDDKIPDDIPRPDCPQSDPNGHGFLFEWFGIFSDLLVAARPGQNKAGINMAAAHYLNSTQNAQRMRENQGNPNLIRQGMINNQYMAAQAQRAAAAGMGRGMVNGAMQPGVDMSKRLTPQQVHIMKQQQMQQAQMQREQGDVEMNGRPGTPADGENGGSPSKRPRLENQQFNGNMMPNGARPMPNQQAGMMIQNSFNPNMNPQFRGQNGGMAAQKAMPPGMPNGMMNMNNGGSPMMPMNGAQFGGELAAMDMYNSARMGGQPMQGGPAAAQAAQSGNHALQDYQMQLMLLEQQNKKRLMMARQEQDNAVNRDGAPMPVGMGAAGMSPSARSGTSPNPEQMKRTPGMPGLPGSPSAGENMQGRSPAAMGFINGMPGGDFNPMFMGDKPGMGPGGPNMRPPTSMDINMARQQGRMNGQFPGGQPMAQQTSQPGQPMGTPGQRNEMPPPQAPAGGSAQRNQPSSPAQSSNAPPTPSQSSKANPKGKKGKADNANNSASDKKKPAKKNSTANAPAENNEAATPTPATPITPQHPNTFNKGQTAPASAPQPQVQQMPGNQQQMQQPDMQANAFQDFNDNQNFNLDFSTLDNTDVLENFDFDSFLNTSTDDAFNFDGSMAVGDFNLDGTD